MVRFGVSALPSPIFLPSRGDNYPILLGHDSSTGLSQSGTRVKEDMDTPPFHDSLPVFFSFVFTRREPLDDWIPMTTKTDRRITGHSNLRETLLSLFGPESRRTQIKNRKKTPLCLVNVIIYIPQRFIPNEGIDQMK